MLAAAARPLHGNLCPPNAQSLLTSSNHQPRLPGTRTVFLSAVFFSLGLCAMINGEIPKRQRKSRPQESSRREIPLNNAAVPLKAVMKPSRLVKLQTGLVEHLSRVESKRSQACSNAGNCLDQGEKYVFFSSTQCTRRADPGFSSPDPSTNQSGSSLERVATCQTRRSPIR